MGVYIESFLKAFSEWARGSHTIPLRIWGRIRGKNLTDDLPHFDVSTIAVNAEIADALKSLWQDMLDHSPDEGQDGQRGMLNGLGLVISVPVADGFLVILLDTSDRNGWGDDVFGQISCQSSPSWLIPPAVTRM